LRAKAQRLERQGASAEDCSRAFAMLAKCAVQSRSDYAEALEAMGRSLELRFERTLCEEAVALHASCGNFRAAADLLVLGQATTELDGTTRRRLATYGFRGRDAERAAHHFSEVARLEPEATDALSALGTIAFWAPEQVSRERGILAWHEAARRHRAQGAKLRAFEATMRAFELDPGSALAAERLARELDAQGRREAADEIWRKSADAAFEPNRHVFRASSALESGDLMAALAALLDGRADSDFGETSILRGVEQLLAPKEGHSKGFDLVLAELGCADWLAVRLELGPLVERWSDEPGAHVALARLETGYFAHLEQAREAYVRALVAHPSHAEARARLINVSGDEANPDALIRSLVQAARTAQEGIGARQLASEIVEREGRGEGSASLLLWALERLRHSLIGSEQRARQLEHCKLRATQEREEIARLWSSLDVAADNEQEGILRELETRLAFVPSETLEHLTAVRRLLEIRPNDAVMRSRFVELIDVVAALVISPSRDERISAALAAAPRLLGERGRLAQARLLLRHGQIEPSLAALRPLLTEANTTVRGLFWVLSLSRRFRDVSSAARAAERLAAAFRPAIRAILEVFSAQLYVDAGEPHEAARLVSGALRTGQNLSRLVSLQVTLAETIGLDVDAGDLERALSRVMPDSSLCRIMARTYRQVGDRALALVWTWRAVSLKPGDVALRGDALSLALELGESHRIVEQLEDLIAQAIAPIDWADLAASALGWLANTEPNSALSLARSLLDIAGPVSRSLRAAALNVARVVGDEAFALEILERSAASHACRSELPELLFALCERYHACGRHEACLSAALRAARCGVPPRELERFADLKAVDLSADGRMLYLELRRTMALAREDAHDICATTLELAVARAELALDVDGAVSLWVDLAQRTDREGWAVVVRDMAEVLGQRVTVERIDALSRFAVHGRTRPRLLVLGAQVGMEAGDIEGAAANVEAALRLDPSCTFVLPLAERLLSEIQAFDRLESLYGSIESAALGTHGARAVHYRAAVSLAVSGQYERALVHATAAFETFPEHEGSYRLLLALALRASDPQSVAAAVTRVADADVDPSRKVAWLRRGYDALPSATEHLRPKFELALKILLGCPRASAIELVVRCLEAASSLPPEELEFMRSRVARALESLLHGLDGPDGARLGIATAIAAVRALDHVELATSALSAALGADGDVDEFASFVPVLLELRPDASEAVRSFLERAFDWLDRPYVALGAAGLELLATAAALFADGRALLHLELRTTALGQEPWLVKWLIEPSNLLWRGIREPLTLAADIVGEWSRDDRELAACLALLELAGKAAASTLGATNLGGAILDEGWQRWLYAYGARLTAALPLAGVEALRDRLLLLEGEVPQVLVAPLRVTLERASGDERALAKALADWSFSGVGTAPFRAELLVEAARLLEKGDDFDGALAYFRAAVGTHRDSTQGKLGLLSSLYRLGRTKTETQANLLLELTSGLEVSVADDERELVVFIRAEALEGVGRRDEARALLKAAEEQLGPRTFIVFGLAEHALRDEDPELALGYFAAALGGNFRGLWRHVEVSLAAAKTAALVGEVELALSWLEPCLADSQTRPEAMALQAELLGATDAAREEATGISESHLDVLDAEDRGVAPGPVVMAKVTLTKAFVVAPSEVSGAASVQRAPIAMSSERTSVRGGESRSGTEHERDAETVVIEVDAGVPGRVDMASSSSSWSDRLGSSASRAGSGFGTIAEEPASTTASHVDRSEGTSDAVLESTAPALGLESLDVSLARTLDPVDENVADENAAMPFEPPASDSPLGAAFHALGDELHRAESEPPARSLGLFDAPSLSPSTAVARPPLSEASNALGFDEPLASEGLAQGGARGALPGGTPDVIRAALAGDHVTAADRPNAGSEQGEDGAHEEVPSGRHRVDLVEPSAYEFAIAVAEELSSEPQRQRAWLPDGKRWLRQWPTQTRLVELVRDAVVAEGSLGHAQALGHVLALLRGEYELPVAPEFAEQSVDIEVIRGLLLRDSGSPGAEALELIWDGAEHEFLREPSDYGVTGVMRVVGTASPLARIYAEGARRLGLARVPLFHRRSAHLGRVQVLLVNPTALLVEGEPVADEDILGYRIGSALWATLPAHSLLFGLEPSYVRSILRALGLAFGSASGHPNPTYGDSMRLAQVLWQTVRSRSQRRLKEICQSELDFEESWEKASQSLRRAGLYVSGNLRTALRMTVEDNGLPLDPADPTSLVQVALTLPEAMDLFRFATSAEYAAVRWQPVRVNPIGGGTRPW
jgi:tetratricopeptide (TPR) repeat protein